MKDRQTNIAGNKGFTLLEVMVEMVIFAVGMLGLAGIQALSLENTHSSYSRSQAILLAYEIVDRMKANPTAGSAYVTTPNANIAQPGTLCDQVACNNLEMAAFDLWQWKDLLPKLLVSGKGQITKAAGSEDYTVTVHWDEDRTGATGTNCPAGPNDLRCFQLIVKL